MRVMYSTPSSKIIISMNSPWLELSNGILFVIFRYRLTHFPFSFFFLLKIGFSRGGIAAGKKGQCFCPCGTYCQRKEQNGRCIIVRVSQVHVVRAHTSCLMRNKHGTLSSPSNSFLSNNFPAPKLPLLYLAALVCTQLGL
jgi:hypothetical protein